MGLEYSTQLLGGPSCGWLLQVVTSFPSCRGIAIAACTLCLSDIVAHAPKRSSRGEGSIPSTRTVVFNDKLKHWGFRPLACAPYRARTKGKTENGVGYVKRNAIAGRAFPRWKPLRCILRLGRGRSPDLRQHGTTAEPPIERFRRVQAQALKPIEAALPSCR
jgi:hypothetical protein